MKQIFDGLGLSCTTHPSLSPVKVAPEPVLQMLSGTDLTTNTAEQFIYINYTRMITYTISRIDFNIETIMETPK